MQRGMESIEGGTLRGGRLDLAREPIRVKDSREGPPAGYAPSRIDFVVAV